MFKSVLIALSTVAAVTLSAGTEANAFGLASAARAIAPKPVAVEAGQSDIACAAASDGCHRGHMFLLTCDARIRNQLAVQTGSGEAAVDSVRRELVVRQVSGNLMAGLPGVPSFGKMPALRLG